MYNRYIPQSDGTYLRSRIPDSPPRQTVSPEIPPQICTEPETPEVQVRPKMPVSCPRSNRTMQRNGKTYTKKQSESLGSFLKQLLPNNFDSADLIVVLLLLLISGDSTEDQNTALLTLALYLFL